MLILKHVRVIFYVIMLFSAGICTKQVKIHVGIAIENEEVNEAMDELKEKIHEKALKNGYFLDTKSNHPLHITLAQGTLDEANMSKCEKCLEEVVGSTHGFGFTRKLKYGKFEVLGRYGVWSIAAEENDQLTQLATLVRDCLKKAGAKLNFKDFKPHISFGIFKNDNGKANFELPMQGIQDWASEPLHIKRLEQKFTIKEFTLSIEEKNISLFKLSSKDERGSKTSLQQSSCYIM